MSSEADNLDQALKALQAGDLDALTPEQMDRLEGLLNSRPQLADTLTGRLAAPDARLRAALDDEAADAGPSAPEWERAWNRISTSSGAASTSRRATGRFWRLWAPLTAAAACLLMAASWWGSALPAGPQPWPMKLATEVEINELEVYGNATAFVVSAGGESGVGIIWVLEEES